MGYMVSERIPAHSISASKKGDLFELIDQFALATPAQIAEAHNIALTTDRHADDILVAKGIVDAALLRRLMASAWLLPVIDLTKDRADRDLLAEWSPEQYVAGNWLPVRDKANGALLVATARRPDTESTARISGIVECPVEFAVATAYDIRTAVERATRAKRMISFIR